jgi:hypothetical protein
MMGHLSIVRIDKRSHRKIAQENWGLTDSQMNGMHVHHFVPRSKGGSNDPSNLYVCSPSFHRWGWHDGEEWIEWASRGGSLGGAAAAKNQAESGMLSDKAKRMHELHKGTSEYHNNQRVKSLRGAVAKRKNWDFDTYEQVRQIYESGVLTGYLIAKQMGVAKWKSTSCMLDCIKRGLTFEQVTDPDKYVEAVLTG